MSNLYRIKHCLKWLLLVSLSIAVPVNAAPQSSNTSDRFIQHLNQVLPSYFDLNDIGVTDPKLNKALHITWQQVMDTGYATRTQASDKEARTIFVQIQAHIERELIQMMDNKTQSIWIIHTPVIATPLVTEGELNGHLVTMAVLKDNDKSRLNTALSRARHIREYLAKGGILITVYHANQREGKHGRTAEQIAIFEKLKQQYPKQLIEFGIDPKLLAKDEFPSELIGTTYLMQHSQANRFEMTNRGVQINDTSDGRFWGVWLQTNTFQHPAVTQQMQLVFDFLKKVGLQEAIARHAREQGIAPEKFSLLGTYWQ